jgi:folate-binding protein YgfZ
MPKALQTMNASELAPLRDSAGLIDRSDVGRLDISGADALDLLNRLTTNKLEELLDGQGLVTVVTNGDARVIDFIALGALDGKMLCLTSPGHAERVVDWLDTYTFAEEISVVDRTAETFQLAIAGPHAAHVLSVAGAPVAGLGLYALETVVIARRHVVVWRMLTGGEDGYEIIGDKPTLESIREALVGAGAVPVSDEAWEAYRIANGMPAAEAEFGAFANPLESGLLGAISDDKGCFTGQEVIARLQTYNKVQRRLMAVAITGSAKAGDKLQADGGSAGVLTSVIALGSTSIGLALVSARHANVGAVLDIASSDGPSVKATLSEPRYPLQLAAG